MAFCVVCEQEMDLALRRDARSAELEAALATERAAREKAEAALREAAKELRHVIRGDEIDGECGMVIADAIWGAIEAIEAANLPAASEPEGGEE